MALIKFKPTSPGVRHAIKIDRSHLYKGGPYEPLTAHQNKTGARNHSGRITTRALATATKTCPMNARPPTRRWCWAPGITSVNAAFRASSLA